MSALEICDVRREIHEELGRELVRQLVCIDVEWALLLRQILLEEEEVREGDVEGKPFLAMFYPSLKLDYSRALLIQYLMELNLTKTTESF